MSELNDTDETNEGDDLAEAGDSQTVEQEAYHIDLSDGGAVDYAQREDGLGWQWTVNDAEGDVLEYARDKTEVEGEGIKHHAVNELSDAQDPSRGWSTDGEGKQWDHWEE
jgi:hypothetical protein